MRVELVGLTPLPDVRPPMPYLRKWWSISLWSRPCTVTVTQTLPLFRFRIA